LNTGALFLCLCLSFGTGESPRDPWLAEDKLMHFAASFAATSISASAARATGLSPGRSALAGAVVGSGLGLWKEVQDHRRPDGFFSYRDMAWDLAGVGAATMVMSRVR
jgi:putative lipoprotein